MHETINIYLFCNAIASYPPLLSIYETNVAGLAVGIFI